MTRRGWRRPLGMAFSVGCLLLLVATVATAQDSKEGPHKVEGISGKNDGDHKPFWPLDGNDIATIILASLGLIVAAGGGIGGGGILVPLYILVMKMEAKRAIPLSNVTILGGSIANAISAALNRHPTADRPLLDWSLILMMEPTTIVGAVVGSFVNKLLPSIIISVLLVIVLGALARRTLGKGIKMFKKEGGWKSLTAKGDEASKLLIDSNNGDINADYKSPVEGEDGPPPPLGRMMSNSLLDTDIDGVPGEILSTRSLISYTSKIELNNEFHTPRSPGRAGRKISGELESLADGGTYQPTAEARKIAEEERTIALWKPLTLTLCFLGVVTINVLKGGGGTSPLGFDCGSGWYWLTTLAVIPWVGIFFTFIRSRILADYQRKLDAQFVFEETDIQWSPINTIKYPFVCVAAGLFAGVFGVGGGIVKGPLMLEMGVLPAVAAASAATMILFTSASATASYYVFNLIPMDYGAFFFVWGFICTGIGQILVTHLLRKYKKESFVILSIGSVIALSAVLMFYESIVNIVHDPSSAMAMSSLCGGGGGE